MLSIAEEVLLIALDDETGIFLYGPDVHLELALSGAVLMDLALANRIDTDLARLFVVDSSPLGDDILDDTLARIAASSTERPTGQWLQEMREDAGVLKERLIGRLVDRGILRRVEEKILGMFPTRRYPVIDDRAELEVKQHITEVLFSDDIPDPRDIAIIDLVFACDLLEILLHARDVKAVRPRVEQIARMDLIGREVSRAIDEVRDQ